ncbi:MAG: sugar ABC transporter permease [Anaerolineales bacterium]|nr:sugar ABC transporter permease [Anaerolineales bacterium]
MTAQSVSGWRKSENRLAWLFASPALFFLFMFVFLPFVMAFVFAFTNQRLVPGPNPTEFVGLRNFIRLVNDQRFIRALLNNFLFVMIVVPVQTVMALLLAVLINQKLRFVNFFRTIYFSPVAITMVVVSVVWAFLYEANASGTINQFVNFVSFGLIEPQDWLGNPNLAFGAIMLLSIWQGVGFQMVIFLAGLQEIPYSLYEAAQIDGANVIQQFFNVTLPMLRNTTLFVVISTTILAFQLYAQVEVLTRGGPQNATQTMVFYTKVMGFEQGRIGYASAITVIFFLIVLGISLVQRAILSEERSVE